MPTSTRSRPWMALPVPGALDEMLAEIGAASVAELFEKIPKDHYRKTPLDMPHALTSEIVKSTPHNQPVAQVKGDVFQDPENWAMTWCAYQRRCAGGAKGA